MTEGVPLVWGPEVIEGETVKVGLGAIEFIPQEMDAADWQTLTQYLAAAQHALNKVMALLDEMVAE